MLLRTVILVTLSLASVVTADDATVSDETIAAKVRHAVDSREQNARPWQYVVVHHSATAGGSVEAIDRNHKARVDSNGNPWRGIGYHFVIGNGDGMPDGKVASTFRWTKQIEGAHAGSKLYNDVGIGVCLIGNFEVARPTAKQTAALKALIARLQRDYKLETTDVIAHGDIRATACPGKLFPRERFLTAMHRTARRIDTNSPLEFEPSCEDVVRTAETSSNWKESR